MFAVIGPAPIPMGVPGKGGALVPHAGAGEPVVLVLVVEMPVVLVVEMPVVLVVEMPVVLVLLLLVLVLLELVEVELLVELLLDEDPEVVVALA